MCTMIFVDVMVKNSFVMNAKQSESEREANIILRNLQLLSSNAIFPANLLDLYF